MCYIVFSFLYVGSCINYLCILRCMYVEQLLLYVLICQVRKCFLIFFYDINIVYRFKFVCRFLLYVPNNRGLPAAFVEVSVLCIKNLFFKSIKKFCNIVLMR